MAADIILSVAYGIQIQPENDPYVDLAERVLKILERAATPGSYLVDTIPALKYVPEWFPGAGFQRQAKEWRKSVTAMPEVTFDFVKKAMARVLICYTNNNTYYNIYRLKGMLLRQLRHDICTK
jgi:hypothetical protein